MPSHRTVWSTRVAFALMCAGPYVKTARHLICRREMHRRHDTAVCRGWDHEQANADRKRCSRLRHATHPNRSTSSNTSAPQELRNERSHVPQAGSRTSNWGDCKGPQPPWCDRRTKKQKAQKEGAANGRASWLMQLKLLEPRLSTDSVENSPSMLLTVLMRA